MIYYIAHNPLQRKAHTNVRKTKEMVFQSILETEEMEGVACLRIDWAGNGTKLTPRMHPPTSLMVGFPF